MESTAATTQLIRSISKFDGAGFVEWQRTLCAEANLVHPEISTILGDQLHPNRSTGLGAVAADPQQGV